MKKIYTLVLVLTALLSFGQQGADSLQISLSVNNSSAPELRPGYPWVITISLTNPTAARIATAMQAFGAEINALPEVQKALLKRKMEGFVIGSNDAPWYRNIRLEFSPEESGTSSVLPVVMLKPFPDAVSRLDFETAAVVCWGLDPEESVLLKTGKYSLRAVLPSGGSELPDLNSDPVVITIRGSAIQDPLRLADPDIFFLIDYWLRRGECSKAEAIISGLRKMPGSVTMATLQAEVFECMGDDASALDAYLDALDLFDEDAIYEPPEYLWEKIHELQEKLGRRKQER